MNQVRPQQLTLTLGAVVLTAAVLQTSVVPILSAIADELRASRVDVGWVVTANLLAAAASGPLIGRLADLRNKKSVLLGTLAVVFTGSLLGAVTSSLPLLVLGRVLQGTSFAVFPISVSILRDELPADRLFRSIGAISATLGLGNAMALLFTGFLMPEGASYHRVFWLLTAMTAVAGGLVAVLVPSRPRQVGEQVDWTGAATLALGLCCLMLAVTKGAFWGWTASQTIGTALAGTSLLAFWWRWTRRCRYPLVAVDLLERRPVLLTNCASFLVGTGSYFSLLGLSTCAASPAASGHGFGADTQAVSLQFLLPGALAATVAAMITGRLIERLGARTVMVIGGTLGVIGFVLLVGWHANRSQLLVAGLMTSAYLSLAYGALTALIVSFVQRDETAVASSLNGIMSKVGGATAAALVAPLLSPVGGAASTSGYFSLFSAGAVTSAAAVLLTLLNRTRCDPLATGR